MEESVSKARSHVRKATFTRKRNCKELELMRAFEQQNPFCNKVRVPWSAVSLPQPWSPGAVALFKEVLGVQSWRLSTLPVPNACHNADRVQAAARLLASRQALVCASWGISCGHMETKKALKELLNLHRAGDLRREAAAKRLLKAN